MKKQKDPKGSGDRWENDRWKDYKEGNVFHLNKIPYLIYKVHRFHDPSITLASITLVGEPKIIRINSVHTPEADLRGRWETAIDYFKSRFNHMKNKKVSK